MKLAVEILYKNKWVQLQLIKNTKISITLYNPMFKKVGTTSLPFKLPTNNLNNLYFNFANRISTCYNMAYNIPAQIKYNGIVYPKGNLFVKKADNDYYEVFFTADRGSFNALVKDKNLQDLDYNNNECFTDENAGFDERINYISNSAFSKYPEYNFVIFPFCAPCFFSKDNPADVEYVKEDENNNEDEQKYKSKLPIINEWANNKWHYNTQDSRRDQAPKIHVISLYLNYIIKRIFSEHGYAIKSSILEEDEDYKTLVVFNSIPSLWGELTDDPRHFGKPKHYYKDYVPNLKIKDFISILEKTLNLTFFINDKTHSVEIKDNTNTITTKSERNVSHLVEQKREIVYQNEKKGYKLSFSKTNDDYNKNEIENFNELETDAENENHTTTLKRYLCNFNPSQTTVNYEVDTFDDLPETIQVGTPEIRPGFISGGIKMITNHIAFVKSESNYYIVKETNDTVKVVDSIGIERTFPLCKWVKYSDKLMQKTSGEEGYSVKTKMTSLALFEYKGNEAPENNTYPPKIIPRFDHVFYEKDLKDKLILLFYRGIISNKNQTCSYPFASYDVYDNNANKIENANRSLRWDGEYGLYVKNFKKFLYWKENIKTTYNAIINYSFLDIVNLDFAQKIRIDESTYLHSKIKIELSENSFNVKSCELVKC